MGTVKPTAWNDDEKVFRGESEGSGHARKHNQDVDIDVMAAKVGGSMPLRCSGTVLKRILTFLFAHNPTDTFTNKLKSLL
jgi:hypothetical protein